MPVKEMAFESVVLSVDSASNVQDLLHGLMVHIRISILVLSAHLKWLRWLMLNHMVVLLILERRIICRYRWNPRTVYPSLRHLYIVYFFLQRCLSPQQILFFSTTAVDDLLLLLPFFFGADCNASGFLLVLLDVVQAAHQVLHLAMILQHELFNVIGNVLERFNAGHRVNYPGTGQGLWAVHFVNIPFLV